MWRLLRTANQYLEHGPVRACLAGVGAVTQITLNNRYGETMHDDHASDRAAAPTLLGISGSLRRASSNTMLVREAARAFGACHFTLADIRLPLYDGDLEDAEGIPPAVARLAEAIRSADAIVISTPEYNKNLPGVLKNALDWLSRTKPAPLAGKPVAIVSSAAGRAGGERAQFSLRHCLTPFQPRVLQGPEVMIAGANAAFDADGRLIDPASVEILGRLMAQLRAEIARVTA